MFNCNDNEKADTFIKFLKDSWELEATRECLEKHGDTYIFGEYKYLVLTEHEADALFDEYLNNYIDDCVFLDIPEHYQNYFDVESYKLDMKYYEGRGTTLSPYDGEEIEKNGYFLYRVG